MDVDIGDDDQAYAIFHGELFHEDRDVKPHLLVTWLYWDQDSEPVYQTDYALEADEVMPSDELEIIPFSTVSDVLGPLKDLPRSLNQCDEHCSVFWKRTHVYVSAESAVTVCHLFFTIGYPLIVPNRRSTRLLPYRQTFVIRTKRP